VDITEAERSADFRIHVTMSVAVLNATFV